MNRNGRHLLIVAVLVIIGAVVTYFVLTAIYQLPEAASAESTPIDQLFNVHFLLISLLFSLIVVFMLYSFVAFRRKPGDEEDGPHIHGNTGLEITWTIIPLVIVIALGVWATFILSDITAAAPNEMVVNVTGQQWSWAFSYPDYEEMGFTNELVLPVDQPVRLDMVTADVIHSFWVVEWRVKQDLLPGQVTSMRITPDREGQYRVRCAEICGLNHAYMLADVRVVSQAEFDQWVADNSVSLADLSPEERGQKWAADFGCTACHSIDGVAGVGPTWLGVYGNEESMADGTTAIVDEAYLLKSIHDPGAELVAGYQDLMPADFEDRFAQTEGELLNSRGIEVDIAADIIAYIRSLGE